MRDRYVIIGIDRTTGDIYVSTEMLEEEYHYDEAQKIVETFNKTMKELRDYIIMPWEDALGLWIHTRTTHTNKTDKTLH